MVRKDFVAGTAYIAFRQKMENRLTDGSFCFIFSCLVTFFLIVSYFKENGFTEHEKEEQNKSSDTNT